MSKKRRKKLLVHTRDWGSESEGVTVQEGEYISKLLRNRDGLMTYITLIDGKTIKAWDAGYAGRDIGDCFDHFYPNSTRETQHLESDFFYASQVVEISDEDGAILFRSANPSIMKNRKE
jgi:hypothetical protein